MHGIRVARAFYEPTPPRPLLLLIEGRRVRLRVSKSELWFRVPMHAQKRKAALHEPLEPRQVFRYRAEPTESARGLAQSKTLTRGPESGPPSLSLPRRRRTRRGGRVAS